MSMWSMIEDYLNSQRGWRGLVNGLAPLILLILVLWVLSGCKPTHPTESPKPLKTVIQPAPSDK